MAQSTPIRRKFAATLLADLQAEVDRMVEAERQRSPAEAILRIRALADISDRLSTEELIELAAAICAPEEQAAAAAPRRAATTSPSDRDRRLPLQ